MCQTADPGKGFRAEERAREWVGVQGADPWGTLRLGAAL